MKEERFPRTRKPLRGQRLQVAEGGKLRSHGGERSHRGAEGKAERSPHRGPVPTSTHQPERLVCSPARAGRGWELRLGLRSDRWQRTGVGGVNSLKGASAPQLAGRESGKRSGAAEEARDNCFGVHEERGFRAPPKRAPETGATTAISTEPNST